MSYMRPKPKQTQSVISFRASDEFRQVIIDLAVKLTAKRKTPCTLTDVIEEAILFLAKREKVDCG